MISSAPLFPKVRALEIAFQVIKDRLYNPPNLDALHASAEIVLLHLSPLGDVHRTLGRWHPGLVGRGLTVVQRGALAAAVAP